MTRLPAVLAAVLLTASLALAVFAGGSDSAQRQAIASSPTRSTLPSGPSGRIGPAGGRDGLAMFAPGSQRQARLPSLGDDARAIDLQPPSRLRDATPRRSLEDPREAAERQRSARRSENGRSGNGADQRRQRRDLDDERRIAEQRQRDLRDRQQRLRDQARAQRDEQPRAQQPDPTTRSPQGPAAPQQAPAASPPGVDASADTPANPTDSSNPFDALIPDTIPEGLRPQIEALLREAGVDPNNPSTFNPNTGGGGGGGGGDFAGIDGGSQDNNDTGIDGVPDDDTPDDDNSEDADNDGEDESPPEDIDGSLAPTASRALWVTVDNSDCEIATLTGLVTNDLYVELTGSGRVVSVDSGVESAGINPLGGQIFNLDAVGDTPPSQALLDADPCNAFDTVFTIQDDPIVFQSAPPILFDSTIVTEYTLTEDAPNEDGLGVLNPAEVPDPGIFVRIARITATPDTQTVTGDIRVGITSPLGTDFTDVLLTIPDEPERWGDIEDPDPNPDPQPDPDPDTDPDPEPEPDPDPSDDDTDPDPDPGDDNGDDPPPDDDDDTDGGGEDGDDADDDETPAAPELVFLQIAGDFVCNVETDPANGIFGPVDVFDLFVRFDQPNEVFAASAGDTVGLQPITFDGGAPAQHPAGSNQFPGLGPFGAVPCLEFDTSFALGAAQPLTLIFAPPPEDWTDPINTLWFVIPPGPTAQQDPAAFGDDGFYVRVLRLALPPGVTPQGQIQINFRPFGEDRATNIQLDIPALPATAP